MTDKEIVLQMAKERIHLDCISYYHLDRFQEDAGIDDKKVKFETIRRRFRNALNILHNEGILSKEYSGTNYYQTGDTLGGKVYIMYSLKEITKHL